MIFKYENKFLQGKDLLSVIDCGEHHNININEIGKRKVEIMRAEHSRKNIFSV